MLPSALMRYRYLTADVFTDRPFGGNPLAVFPEARGISSERMQQVAREMNLSETVFVLPPEEPRHTRKLRIFTPGTELPFAGHPTVGTAFVLAAIGEIPLAGPETRIVFEEGVGPVPVLIRAEGGKPVFAELTAAKLPEVGPPPPSIPRSGGDALARSGGPAGWRRFSRGGLLRRPLPLHSAARTATPSAALACGSIAGRRSSPASGRPRSTSSPAIPSCPAPHVRSRMFAPRMGIVEDPATGAATASFGGYLASRAPERDGTLRWVIEQGFEMGRPSILHLEADKRDGGGHRRPRRRLLGAGERGVDGDPGGVGGPAILPLENLTA